MDAMIHSSKCAPGEHAGWLRALSCELAPSPPRARVLRGPSPDAEVLIRMLDHVGIGVMALTTDARVVFSNRAARDVFAGSGSFRLEQGVLSAASPADKSALTKALQLASLGRRSLLRTTTCRGQRYVGVVPLACGAPGAGDASHVVAGLILGRLALCDSLGIDAFGRQHGLTLAECAVLACLCDGHTPREIAEQKDVAVCTIRSHVRSILEKSGARSVSHLLRVTAMLPPVLPLAT